VREAAAWGAAALAATGCESPRLDAELLLGAALGMGRAELVMRDRAAVGAEAWDRFAALIGRREAREPIAYILGIKAFRRISLTVDPRVLIPRPETEMLVEVGLELPAAARVADVGTGCGAVALALKDERPDLRVVGVDISGAALEVARANAARLALDVRFVEADLLDGGEYDAVLANLPYVEEGASLAAEIAGYEPSTALYAGEDGLDVVRRLVARLGSGVATARLVALEVGFGQADAVAGLLAGAGFGEVSRLRDLAGVERVVLGRR
jgi:release factor glutamine methyltransferase